MSNTHWPLIKQIMHQEKEIPSRWNGSVRAVRNTPMADYSAPGVNNMSRVTYRPLIAVSHFLLARSVPYFNCSLWHCGQLWPYIGMGSLGMRLHRDWNAMSDAAKISARVLSICVQNVIFTLLIIHIIQSCHIYVAIGNASLVMSVYCLTTNSFLWNYVCAAANITHAENLQSKSCRCCAHFNKFRDGIQVA